MELGTSVTLISSVYLCGLSATVALVIYPSFAFVGEEHWLDFHRQHSTRITWAVGPAWLAQAGGLGIWLLRGPHQTWPSWIITATAAFAAVVLTMVAAVPIHSQLSHGFDETLHHRLLRYHWFRTLAWSLCAGGATWALVQIS